MATMRDVALRAGVSSATVSYIVNNTKPVNESTRLRVEAAMAELGFRRNELARALASNRTRMIALSFPALRHRLSATAVTFFTAAAEAAAEQGYTLVLWPGDAENIAGLANGGMIDGLVLMEVELDDPRVAALTELHKPFTLIGRTRDPSALSYVDVDFEGIVAESVARLVALGHRSIALILGNVPLEQLADYAPAKRTEDAFREALQRHGIVGTVHACAGSSAEGRSVALTVFAEAPSTTAFFVFNESAAIGVVSGLKRLGKRIPEDVSVMLGDTSADIASLAEPELAVMVSPAAALGRMGVESLIDILENRETPIRHELVMATFRDGPSLGVAPTG